MWLLLPAEPSDPSSLLALSLLGMSLVLRNIGTGERGQENQVRRMKASFRYRMVTYKDAYEDHTVSARKPRGLSANFVLS